MTFSIVFLYECRGMSIWPFIKGQSSTKDHHLNNFGRPRVIGAIYQVSRFHVSWFWRRRFSKGFYHIWAWRPSWSCDPDFMNKIIYPYPVDAPNAFFSTSPVVSEEMSFEKIHDVRKLGELKNFTVLVALLERFVSATVHNGSCRI